jgi:hypothetical protein
MPGSANGPAFEPIRVYGLTVYRRRYFSSIRSTMSSGKAFAYLSKVVLPGETIVWDAGNGLKVGDERSVTLTARRVSD